MPRFVLLEHDYPLLHWDFMLETGATLRTWRLAAVPCAGQAIAATALGDHRLAYLDYEGALSGHRGTVRRWDYGDYALLEDSAARIVVELKGGRICGKATLASNADSWTWTLEAAD